MGGDLRFQISGFQKKQTRHGQADPSASLGICLDRATHPGNQSLIAFKTHRPAVAEKRRAFDADCRRRPQILGEDFFDGINMIDRISRRGVKAGGTAMRWGALGGVVGERMHRVGGKWLAYILDSEPSRE